MSKEKELLERLLENFERPVTGRFWDLFDEVRELLSTPEPTQNEEPIAWWNGITPEMSEEEFWIARCIHYGIASRKTDDCDIPLYLHPAPRSEFVRLSEAEVTEILTSAYNMYEAICAVENRLVEKNK